MLIALWERRAIERLSRCTFRLVPSGRYRNIRSTTCLCEADVGNAKPFREPRQWLGPHEFIELLAVESNVHRSKPFEPSMAVRGWPLIKEIFFRNVRAATRAMAECYGETPESVN